MTLSILIPVYNEEDNIQKILDRVRAVTLVNNIAKQIVIVNDCSTDGTEELVLRYIEKHNDIQIEYQKHSRNKGKGRAINTALKMVKGDFVIIQDADNEYDPEEYNLLLKPIIDNYADVVYGSRFMGGNPHRILFFWHRLGNNFLTFLSNMFSNLNLTDMETCYKMFRREVIQSIEIKENRFGIEPEITAKMAKIKGIRIYEVGISYYGRTYEEGKKIGWKDGFRAIYCIFKYNIF
ncbi:MAG: Polyprenol monophosphomannose synthase [Bacteroidetes bacterium MED-G17]|nr:MAG: Polyprenol monophosphomannose synthase [Bacteroidetes bacterium MED-G17]